MTPKQKNSYILDIKNNRNLLSTLLKRSKTIIITTILTLIGTTLKILGKE